MVYYKLSYRFLVVYSDSPKSFLIITRWHAETSRPYKNTALLWYLGFRAHGCSA